MAQIVGIGANVLDTICRLDTFPTEDSKHRAISVTECGGGPCGTGLVAAAKLGATCAYIGNCSDDTVGIFLRHEFEQYEVDTSMMSVVCGTQGFRSSVWLADDSMSRTCVFHRGDVPGTSLGPVEVSAIREAKILMIDGNDLEAAVSAASIARENGTLVLYDAGGLYSGVERLLALTDILIPSEEFALAYTGEASAVTAAKALWEQYCPKVVVITQGRKGGVIYDGVQLRSYPAFQVDAIDTNGSGDVFHGAFAFALIKGWNYFQCCVFSSAVSALKCTQIGARKGVPTYEAAMAFLKSRHAAL